jgi:hypothetical protein
MIWPKYLEGLRQLTCVHPQQSPQKKKIKKKSKKSSAIFPFEALTLNKSEKSIYYNNNNNNYNNSRKRYYVSQD